MRSCMEMGVEMARGLLRITLLLVWTSTGVLPGYMPIYTPGSQTLYNETGSWRHPDGYLGASSYFRSTSISSDVPGMVLVGGADHMTMLNMSTLGLVQRLTFAAAPPALANCTAHPTAYDVDYECRNHLGVFPSNPANPAEVVVCGSEAMGTPSCRAIRASGADLGEAYTSVPAAGIVPSSSKYFGYGSFFNVSSYSNTNFFAAVNTYSSAYLAFYTIKYSNPMDPNSLNVYLQFRTPTARNWFSDPTRIVDVVKFEYPPRPPNILFANTITPDEHKFFLVFMTEANDYLLTPNTEVISRVARICQNDPGSPVPDTGTGYAYPTTFMKAQIYCRRNTLSADYPSSYTYHYLQSVALNLQQGGRYSQSQRDPPIRLLYGSFTTSPYVGGKTSAICVYSAQDTKNYPTDAGGTSNTVVDAFRLNLINAVTNQTSYNILVQCDPQGRWVSGSQYPDYVKVAPPTMVVQYYSDPLVVLNGVNVVKMAVDQVCVTYNTTTPGCLMQDVLFLGTDDGKVMKVVLTARGTPVVVEELTFDDNNPINQLSIQSSNNSFVVTTDTKVYIVPLERCSFKYGANCSACIQSRDPYCVWNYRTQMCEHNYQVEPGSNISSSFNSSLSVSYYQNIHTGVVQNLFCPATAVPCSLAMVTDPANQVPEIQVKLVGANCSSVIIRVTGLFSSSAAPTSLTMPVPLSGSVTLSTSIIGYQSYEVMALSPMGMVGRAVLTTRPQAPSPKSVGFHMTPLNSTSFRVNVQVVLLTDNIQNYTFKVHYMTTTLPSMSLVTIGQSLVVVDSALKSGTPFNVTVTITNTQGSTSLTGVVTLPLPPATCTTSVAAITATSISLLLTSTMASYPGYTILLNGSKRSDCTQPLATPTTVTVGGLTPFTSYNISVQACNKAGEGPSCGVAITTLCAAPGRVGGLVVSLNTSQLLQFTWQRPLNPNGPLSVFKITRRCYPSVAGQPSTVTTQTSTTLTIPSLPPSSSCCVTVSAINMCASTTYEGLGTTTCGHTQDTPPTVQNLTAVVLSPHSVALTWAGQQVTGVRYSITSLLGTTNISNVASVIVEGLSQEILYSFTVQPFTSTYAGAGVTINVTIPSPAMVPVPGTLAVVPNSTTQVMFAWSGGGTLVQQYRVYLQCGQVTWVLYVAPPTSNLTADISDHGADFGSCVITVQAVNALGPSGNSSVTTATVVTVPNRPPAPPTSYVRNSRSSGTTFSWATQHPFSLANLTVLSQLTSSGYGLGTTPQAYNGSSTVVFATFPGAQYTFSTQLCGTWVCGLPSSNLVNFTTSSILLPPPSDCKVWALTSSSISLMWSTPVGVVRENTSYQIFLSGPAPQMQVGVVVPSVSTDPQTWSRTGLSAETNYIVSVGTIGTTGAWGPVTLCATVVTPSAPLSSPLNMSTLWRVNGYVYVFWQAPSITNGSVVVYEVLWHDALLPLPVTCDNSSVGSAPTAAANTTSLEYSFSAPNASTSLLVCVRGYNRGLPGAWAWRQATPLLATPTATTAAQGSTPLGRDPGLLAAVILSFVFMVSTAVLTVVVTCCCWHHTSSSKWSPKKSDGIVASD